MRAAGGEARGYDRRFTDPETSGRSSTRRTKCSAASTCCQQTPDLPAGRHHADGGRRVAYSVEAKTSSASSMRARSGRRMIETGRRHIVSSAR